MSVPISQERHRQQLLADLGAVNARAQSAVAGLDERRMTWNPPEGGWSVAQVFEHLCISNDSYFPPITALLDRPDRPRASANAMWKPSLIGGLLANSLRPSPTTRKLPAPRKYRVGSTARPNVVAEFMARQLRIAELLERSASVHWTRARLGSPVLPLLRMNLGDAFTIMVVHDQRHLEQIERVRRRADQALSSPTA